MSVCVPVEALPEFESGVLPPVPFVPAVQPTSARSETRMSVASMWTSGLRMVPPFEFLESMT